MMDALTFEMSWKVERSSFSLMHMHEALSLLNHHAIEGDASWDIYRYLDNETKQISSTDLKKYFPEGEVLFESKSGENHGGAYFRREIPSGIGTYSEYLEFATGVRFTDAEDLVKVGCSIDINSPGATDLFSGLMKIFHPDHCWLLPEYWGCWGWTEIMLEAALQRDYAWGPLNSRLHPEQIALAKSMAAMLPRIGFECYNPKDMVRPLIPQRLGWLNCWSPQVAEHLGFPDSQKDADILPMCKQLPSGHWIVQITPDPFDLTRPDHVQAIVRAYWRFEKIGRRLKPAAKKAAARKKPVRPDPASLQTYLIHERDANGNWWQSDYPPVSAASEEDALRIYLCKLTRSRMPRPDETTNRLRKAYDAVALEVGAMPLAADVQARLRE